MPGENAQNTYPSAIPNNNGNKPDPWWKHPRARLAAWITLGVLFLCFLVWLFFFFPYVSTNDARIAATIIRLAPEAPAGGRVLKINVDEGDTVQKGQVLLEIDPRAAQAQLQRAQAQAVLTAANLRRTQQLANEKGVPPRDLDVARAAAQTAEADLKLAELALERCNLKSPVNGIVIQRTSEVGNILEPNQTALTLADIDTAWVSCNIEEGYAGRVKPDQPVKISVDEGGRMTGTVEETDAASAAQFALIPAENPSGNYIKLVQRIPVKIKLDSHPDLKLRVGESVEVKIKVH